MKTITNKKLGTAMIISGSILVLITILYFSNQWVQSNSRWFVFGDGIVIFILGLVILLSITRGGGK